MYERTDRKFNEYRNLKMTTGFISSADGSVLIPQALRPYMGGCDRLIPKH